MSERGLLSEQVRLPAPTRPEAYQACDPPYPVPFEERNALYAKLPTGRGGAVLRPIESAIRFSPRASFHLVAGHIGCGKSTELLQLAHFLEHGGQDALTVVRIDAVDEVNLLDVEFPDMLLAIFNATLARLGAAAKFRQVATRFSHDLSRLMATPIESGQLGNGLASLRLSLTQNAAERAELRQRAVRALGELVNSMNQLASSVGDGRLVLVLDNFEKMSCSKSASTFLLCARIPTAASTWSSTTPAAALAMPCGSCARRWYARKPRP